jgi:transposase
VAVTDRAGLPIALSIASASPHETKLVEETLDRTFVRATPTRLIGDKGYDSDPLDRHLLETRGIELIAPDRSNKRRKLQDLRKLRRYRRRWKVERLFAWLQQFRRVVTRYEYRASNFLGMVQLACVIILLRHL